jgi:hypothetical protein
MTAPAGHGQGHADEGVSLKRGRSMARRGKRKHKRGKRY